jgi:hypothetical protein
MGCRDFAPGIIEGETMPRLNAPSQLTFLIALVLAVLGVLAIFVSIPFVSGYAFWFVTVGFIVLALGCIMKGM